MEVNIENEMLQIDLLDNEYIRIGEGLMISIINNEIEISTSKFEIDIDNLGKVKIRHHSWGSTYYHFKGKELPDNTENEKLKADFKKLEDEFRDHISKPKDVFPRSPCYDKEQKNRDKSLKEAIGNLGYVKSLLNKTDDDFDEIQKIINFLVDMLKV